MARSHVKWVEPSGYVTGTKEKFHPNPISTLRSGLSLVASLPLEGPSETLVAFSSLRANSFKNISLISFR